MSIPAYALGGAYGFPSGSSFDPYLPCNSRWSIPEVRIGMSVNATITPNDGSQPAAQQANPAQPNAQQATFDLGSILGSGQLGAQLSNVITGLMGQMFPAATGEHNYSQPGQPPRPTVAVDESLLNLMNQLGAQRQTSAAPNSGTTPAAQSGEQPSTMTDEMFTTFVNGVLGAMGGQSSGTIHDMVSVI